MKPPRSSPRLQRPAYRMSLAILSRCSRAGAQGAFLFLLAAPLGAAEYTLDLGSSSTNANWSAAPWQPAGNPGSSDTVVVTSAGNLFLETDRTLDTLRGSGNFRIRNGYVGTSGVSTNNKLTVNRIEAISGNSFQFFNRSSTATLSVEAGSLTLGTAALNAAVVNIGQVGGNTPIEGFKVTGTTTLHANSKLNIAESNGVELGRVVFASATAINRVPTISFTTTTDGAGASYAVSVKSLSAVVAEAPYAAITTSGTAHVTLRITGPGTSGTANRYRYDGILSDGSGGTLAVEKNGMDLQILGRQSGNTYTAGTVINSGILAVANETGSGLGSGAVTVSANGILAGNGRVELGTGRSTTVDSGGSIAPSLPGTDGFSTLTFSGASNGSAPVLTMQTGASFTFRLGSENTADALLFSSYSLGDLVLNGNTVNVTGIDVGTYALFRFQDGSGNATATGLAGGLQLGTGFEGWESKASFIYDNAAGVIYLEVIPEPTTTLLAVVGIGAAAFLFRKRQSKPISDPLV